MKFVLFLILCPVLGILLLPLIVRFDTFLIDHILEPFTQWFQKVFGLNNFFWAQLSAVAVVMCAVWDSLKAIQVEWSLVGTIIMTVVIVVWVYVALFFVPTLEKRVIQSVSKGLKNGLRVVYEERRIRCIFLIIPFVGLSYIDQKFKMKDFIIPYGLTCLWIYFICVTPLPPSQSKLRQALKTLFTKQVPCRAEASN
jgi:hypothetical protein